MNIEILKLFPAMIVVSNERENESSENAKENQTRRREEPLREMYQPKMKELQKQKCYAESQCQFYQDLNTMLARCRFQC